MFELQTITLSSSNTLRSGVGRGAALRGAVPQVDVRGAHGIAAVLGGSPELGAPETQ